VHTILLLELEMGHWVIERAHGHPMIEPAALVVAILLDTSMV